MSQSSFCLEPPSLARLAGYADALERGWSPNNLRDVSGEQLEAIRANASAFIAGLMEQGGMIRLPDGREVPKLPSLTRWVWDGEFCGQIGLRWQPGTEALPAHVLGHIGFAMVPWKRRRGYATRALGMMLPQARGLGLRRLELTTEADNVASRRVIEANGGRLEREFVNRLFGAQPRLLYVIDLAENAAVDSAR
jgi:predicted acetyltransferase